MRTLYNNSPRLTVDRIDQQNLGNTEYEEFARVYADVFKGDPWGEYTRCPRDGKFFGVNTQPGESSECCGQPLELAYPLEVTSTYVRKEVNRSDALLLAVRDVDEDSLVGFSWAFTYGNSTQFAREKYDTQSMRERVVDVLARYIVRDEPFYYLSETGIIADERYRGRGVSNVAHVLRLERARDLGLSVVQRTNIASPMYRTSRSAGMQQIVGPIGEYVGRGDLTVRENPEVIIDSEMPSRVLFVKNHVEEGSAI